MTDCQTCSHWPGTFCPRCEIEERDNRAVLDDRLVATARTAGHRLVILLAVAIVASGLVLTARVLGW